MTKCIGAAEWACPFVLQKAVLIDVRKAKNKFYAFFNCESENILG